MYRRTWAETCDCKLTSCLDLAEAADMLCSNRNPNAVFSTPNPNTRSNTATGPLSRRQSAATLAELCNACVTHVP